MRFIVSFLFSVIVAECSFAQGYFSSIGYTELQARLGAGTPTGFGVRVAQVEAPNGNGFYSADPALALNRPDFTMTFNGTMTTPGGFSGHADGVAANFWANTSMAIGVTRVDSWDANTWINTFLDGNGSGIPPSIYLPKVSNHSYIGILDPPNTPNGFFEAEAISLTLRSDYLVHVTGHIMVVGAGNNGASEPSAIFGNGYNSIAVGRSDGGGGMGFTTLSGPGIVAGRVKPDLVAPQDSVSAATPIVASAATLLVETAGANVLAAKPQTIKAILMAGATKSQFDAASGGPWSHSNNVPLDSRFGAGQVNINNSHLIMTAGRQVASTNSTVASTGWDYNSITPGGENSSRRYFFDVAAGQTVTSLSAVLTWHREFQVGDATNFSFADLNLRLYSADSNFILSETPLDQSLSSIDNVEHIWRTNGLTVGRYALVVDTPGALSSEYAIAWQVIAVPEPTAIGGVAFLVIGLIVQRTRPT